MGTLSLLAGGSGGGLAIRRALLSVVGILYLLGESAWGQRRADEVHCPCELRAARAKDTAGMLACSLWWHEMGRPNLRSQLPSNALARYAELRRQIANESIQNQSSGNRRRGRGSVRRARSLRGLAIALAERDARAFDRIRSRARKAHRRNLRSLAQRSERIKRLSQQTRDREQGSLGRPNREGTRRRSARLTLNRSRRMARTARLSRETGRGMSQSSTSMPFSLSRLQLPAMTGSDAITILDFRSTGTGSIDPGQPKVNLRGPDLTRSQPPHESLAPAQARSATQSRTQLATPRLTILPAAANAPTPASAPQMLSPPVAQTRTGPSLCKDCSFEQPWNEPSSTEDKAIPSRSLASPSKPLPPTPAPAKNEAPQKTSRPQVREDAELEVEEGVQSGGQLH